MTMERRLSAILSADVVGYSRLMGANEVGTLMALNERRAEVLEPAIAIHKGRIVKLTGDGLLAEFASVVGAVECATGIQQGLRDRNAGQPEDRRIEMRIGINLGDVIAQDGDIYGDGVNLAARIEGAARPGSVELATACIASTTSGTLVSRYTSSSSVSSMMVRKDSSSVGNGSPFWRVQLARSSASDVSAMTPRQKAPRTRLPLSDASWKITGTPSRVTWRSISTPLPPT